jgi:hypothetical protein
MLSKIPKIITARLTIELEVMATEAFGFEGGGGSW